jgi:hypothetical protein
MTILTHVEIPQQSPGGDTRFNTQAIERCRRLAIDRRLKLFHTLQQMLGEFLSTIDG